MDVTKIQIPIKDIVAGYKNDTTTHKVEAYNGKLNVRPAYQREFVYPLEKQKAVIDSISHGYPLGVMYLSKIGPDKYELLDGQQRILSICSFVADNSFTVEFDGVKHPLSFANLTSTYANIRNQILDYTLDVYICEGTDSETLAWFRTINTAGERLTTQELRNAVYHGTWCTSARALFSFAGGRGVMTADMDLVAGEKAGLLKGDLNRQDYLETAIRWIAYRDNLDIDGYMSKHQNDHDARDLYRYFSEIIEWVRTTFTTYRSSMKGIDWGIYYADYKNGLYPTAIAQKTPNEIENAYQALISSDEVQAKGAGIYKYILTGEDKHLNLRTFDEKDKRRKYEEQKHLCPKCVTDGITRPYAYEEMEGDHIVPWSKGGKTEYSNLQMLCLHHNRTKSSS